MVYALQGWLPGDSHAVRRAERVFLGDHSGPGLTPCARGLTNLAPSGRLFLLTVAMTDRVVHHG